MTPRHANKPDTNKSIIVDALRDVGAYVISMQPEDGFDILVAYCGKVYICEIKRPGHVGELTDNEKDKRDSFERVGVPYHIVTEIDDALAMLGWRR